ncbi:MAG: hypothetical protein ABFC38_08445 [Methanospirillum sp.]
METLKGKVDYVLIGRMIFHYADREYREHGLEDALTDEFFHRATRDLRSL